VPREPSSFRERDTATLAAIGLLLVAAAAMATAGSIGAEWREYQSGFRRLVEARSGPALAAGVLRGPQQIRVPALGRVDRCITCHQAIAWRGFENAAAPFRTHDPSLLETHPVEQFGCTACHGGRGRALDREAAHGLTAEWPGPMLGRSLGTACRLPDPRALIQVRCNACHRLDRETPGADALNRGRRIVRERGCSACHVIDGTGGAIGPDLTAVGDKEPAQYDYSRVAGRKSVFAWHVAHLLDPRAVTAETVMPNFGLAEDEAQALAILVMSWTGTEVPAAYLAGLARVGKRVMEPPAEPADRQVGESGPGAWFVTTGCTACHGVASLGLKSASQIGPDLSLAVASVRNRYGRSTGEFLDAPTGTMAAVLSRQIILTREQKAVAAEQLRIAFAEYERQAVGIQRPSGR